AYVAYGDARSAAKSSWPTSTCSPVSVTSPFDHVCGGCYTLPGERTASDARATVPSAGRADAGFRSARSGDVADAVACGVVQRPAPDRRRRDRDRAPRACPPL